MDRSGTRPTWGLTAQPSLIGLCRQSSALEKLFRVLPVSSASATGRPLRRHRALSKTVTNLDELGLQALDRQENHRLFKVIAYGYERSATIITWSKGVRDWGDMLACEELLATAILDRLLHHCHVVRNDGRSLRLRQMEMKAS